MEIALAEALLRRKELKDKVEQLRILQAGDFFEVKVERKRAHENLDDIIARVPKLTASQVTEEYDFYARSLRLVDAVIQQTNWTARVNVEDSVMKSYADR